MVKTIQALAIFFKSNFLSDLQFRRVFNKKVLDKVTKEIVKGEKTHGGQIVFVVENLLPMKYILKNQSSRVRAGDLFLKLGVNKTLNSCGVLIYILYSGKKIEIIADSGLSAKIPSQVWGEICRKLAEKFKNRAFENGALEAISDVNFILCQHLPKVSSSRNELSDKPIII